MTALLAAVAGLPNASEPIPGWVTGGQPTAAHVAALRDAGCDVILDNRDPMEPRPFDEPRAVRAAGMEYVNVPLVHGAVTAAALIPYLILDKKMEEEAAVDVAMKMGLRSAELMELALQYVRSR